MLCEWLLLVLYSRRLLADASSRTKSATRLVAALAVLAIIGLQGYLYHALIPDGQGESDRFLTWVFVTQHTVALGILFAAAARIKSKRTN